MVALLETDRRWTIRELACETGFSHTTVLHILKERLHMRKIASRWVPHSLTEIQKWQRYESARMHLKRYKKKGGAFLHRIIALDEAWVRAYEPEMKWQSNIYLYIDMFYILWVYNPLWIYRKRNKLN